MDPTDSPLRRTRATLMLAQAAQSADGMLNVLGAGWTHITAGMPFAIAAIVEMPWDAAGEQHTVRFELLDDQGKPVVVPWPPNGELGPVVIPQEFPLAARVGVKRGTPLTAPIAINIGPLPLEPNKRFEWRLEIDGDTHEDWRLGFNTVPQPPQAMAA